MLTPDYIINNIKFPTKWKILKKGVEKEVYKKTQRIYILISTPKDIISILGFLKLKFENSSLAVGWKLKKYEKLLGHKVMLMKQPGDGRSQYIWYCPISDATFMINFSLNPVLMWKIIKNLRCH